jgi:hypothetical protein
MRWQTGGIEGMEKLGRVLHLQCILIISRISLLCLR